eukprot:CAMPEP_0183473852 /NCGR_PEP_ID=MMETSP0370-20130417/162071_1 /TAXON_ID=268820 /ORGANISM="Peridinium aciculiferum, Strain PAER-2" /LENGTH=151 /DNA_ID=CAMNT_0025666557 /DNA_START=56 /DNA_END=507 /DNA_ORIENTATION=-
MHLQARILRLHVALRGASLPQYSDACPDEAPCPSTTSDGQRSHELPPCAPWRLRCRALGRRPPRRRGADRAARAGRPGRVVAEGRAGVRHPIGAQLLSLGRRRLAHHVLRDALSVDLLLQLSRLAHGEAHGGPGADSVHGAIAVAHDEGGA